MKKVHKLKKPRATYVYFVLISKVCEVHEPKVGKKSKRAKQKAAARKEMQQ